MKEFNFQTYDGHLLLDRMCELRCSDMISIADVKLILLSLLRTGPKIWYISYGNSMEFNVGTFRVYRDGAMGSDYIRISESVYEPQGGWDLIDPDQAYKLLSGYL